jgi:hypothetical protein
MKERDRLEDLDVDGRVTLMNFTEIVWDGVNWIHLTGARASVGPL